ncbi:leucyl/phenylalanyl-tRNA--protein transferase [Mobilicoccus pelagius]|uniref:Leucyl/phenylalanyl-tRNA--protein transferase n=1 Tax=Mobilicoccus pelagius NBRC 104925 TaxID=1089455 RepID=H5UUU7_9MICO|nr:leucyl/phenylalanyl-tRNA--protein transferase [Mobilicoccus pelagius]GAB49505.1 leucyl/phenylalanyl-tRNA--protein transferase [Mobilicoccus pelagius NBRC 104925]
MSDLPPEPIEPPPSHHRFDARGGWGREVVGVGADLEPGTLLEAYRSGVFPMGVGRHGAGPLVWWAPDPRGVLLPGGLRVSRSLRKSMRTFDVTVDADFAGVLAGCADPGREGRWITPAVAAAYTRLHRLGWAHSVEVWRDGDLVGGLYGIAVGGLFAGESMFHRATDASKVALVALVERWFADHDPRRLVDTQWSTPHLASLGVVDVPRTDYLRRLSRALEASPTLVPTTVDASR